MPLDAPTRDQIDSLVGSNEVMLFMKGNHDAPQCGFSATVIRILDTLIPTYETYDVLSNPALRDGIKEYSQWPTIPQLYVKGEFIGGCDIIQELFDSGELQQQLGIDVEEVPTPTLTITDAAAEGLRGATDGANPEQALHLGVDARYQNSLFLGPIAANSIEIQANGITIRMDPISASRSDGVTIDSIDTPQGRGFRIDNPNAPNDVKQITAAEVAQHQNAGKVFEFLDVRTPQERDTASISGATLLTPEESSRVEGLSKDTMLVFHCHHGGRSQSAAEHFASLGFTNVWNLTGGIDAWSREVDPSVPQY
jgi:monothiol glutaredoxin